MATSNIGKNYPTFSLIFSFIVRKPQPTNMLRYQNSSYFLLYNYYHILQLFLGRSSKTRYEKYQKYIILVTQNIDFFNRIKCKVMLTNWMRIDYLFLRFIFVRFFRNSIFRFIPHSFFRASDNGTIFCYRHFINKWYSFLILFLHSSNKNEIRPLEGYKIREANT